MGYFTFIFSILMIGRGFLFGETTTTTEPLVDPFSLSEPLPVEAPPETNFYSEFFYMLLMLSVLIGIVMLISRLLKKILNTRIDQANAGSSIKVLERRPLSPRTHLVLIELHGKKMLLAETPTTVVPLPLE